MKKSAPTIIIIILIAVAGYFFFTKSSNVTTGHFDEVTDTINQKIDRLEVSQKIMQKKLDSIMFVLDNIEQNQENMMFSIDTLKAGQILIYDEVTNFSNTKQTTDNWANNLINFLK